MVCMCLFCSSVNYLIEKKTKAEKIYVHNINSWRLVSASFLYFLVFYLLCFNLVYKIAINMKWSN